MTVRADELVSATCAAEGLAEFYANRPLDGIAWLPGQWAFLHDPSKVKLARWGNQWGGKTTAGLAEVIWRCEGAHPFLKVPNRAIEAWIICASWAQSVAVQEKFWNLVDRSLLDDSTVFNPKNGFGAKNPTIRFKNGSVVRFRTTNQGGLNLSAATIDVAMFDEPPTSQRIYVEVSKRLMRRQGTMLLTLTPVNADVDWLRKLCEEGKVADHHYRMEAANLVPVGETAPLMLPDGRPMDQEWIDEEIEKTPEYERPVVCHGEWDFRLADRVFTAFRPEHVHARPNAGENLVLLGADHGSKVGKQVALLVYLLRRPGDHPLIYVLDEDVDEVGERTPEEDAAAILAMLDRHDLAWHEIDEVWSDRLYLRGGLSKKSSKDLQASIAKKLKLPAPKLRPPVWTVKRGEGHGAGSVRAGVRYLHHAMLRPGGFGIHPRCKHLIEALNRWDFTDDIHKDKIDALRYALDSFIFTNRARGANNRNNYQMRVA